MKKLRRISAWAVVLLVACEGGDTMVPAPPPAAPPPPPPIAASVVIETRKIAIDYLSDVEFDFTEWVESDTLIIDHVVYSPVIRVTAKKEDGSPVTGVEPTVTFSTGTNGVTYRTLPDDDDDEDDVSEIRLQRESHQYWTIFSGPTPAEAQILTAIASVGNVADSIVVVLATTLDVATDPQTLPQGVALDDIGERASTPLDWFTSRARADISYEFYVDETPDDDDSGPAILDVVQNDSGELEITAIGKGMRYLHYRAMSSAYEMNRARILTAVDECYVPELKERTLYDRASTGFRIELVYHKAENWSPCAKVILDHAIGLYETALKDNTEPSVFQVHLFDGREDCSGIACGGPVGSRVDRREGDGSYFPAGGVYWTAERPHAAPFGAIPDNVTYEIMVHELGHVFGVGTYWNLGVGEYPLRNPSFGGSKLVDTHFPGPKATAAFNEAGGSDYSDGKVPVANDPEGGADGHWRSHVVCGEIMTYWCGVRKSFSAITLGALADFGWVVDMSVAEEFTLPSSDMAASALPDTVRGHDDVLIRVEPPDRR